MDRFSKLCNGIIIYFFEKRILNNIGCCVCSRMNSRLDKVSLPQNTIPFTGIFLFTSAACESNV
jgi:hypothetical protein